MGGRCATGRHRALEGRVSFSAADAVRIRPMMRFRDTRIVMEGEP